ncbi:MAG: aminotransferase class V-fold PLP-dependent enzyme [Planctomycetaceae bacterium]|nr:aminotransferase class V-fold PLP-dependent enzyme [Planctomycetaceae bacterium]
MTIYLDNAATSFPKPESVYAAVQKALRECGGNPGRSGHSAAAAAAQIIAECRLLCAKLFHAESPKQIVFTPNATTAVNIALKGILTDGDHVITGSFEHNAVARPLYCLEQSGIITVTKIKTDIDSGIPLSGIEDAVLPQTKLVVCQHVSNVFGTMNDLAGIGTLCRKKGILFLADAAQSAGCKPIDVQAAGIDMLVFSGHKSLFGPQGTGGLYIRSGLRLNTLIEGGTGSFSEDLMQPETLPERLESGTPNTPGLAGLAAGLRFVLETGIPPIETKESQLVEQLFGELSRISGLEVFGSPKVPRGTAVSFRSDRRSPEEIAAILDAGFGIAVRSGLHCTGEAHRHQHSTGTVRVSPNFLNTESDIASLIQAVKQIVN